MSASLPIAPPSWGRGIVVFGHMIRFSHSVFALPFALAGVLYALHLGANTVPPATWFWVVAAMVAARTAAMAFNRLVDRRMDAVNPRTRTRELPRGAVSARLTAVLTALAAGFFVFAAARLNPLCLALSPLALAVILGYSYTKRFTWACHLFLGLSLAAAPVGGWLAVTGRWDWTPFLLGFAVFAWGAGMDIVYALQDEAFDRAHGMHSIPARFGRRRALAFSALLHVLAVAGLAALYWRYDLSGWYWPGIAAGAALLFYEHRIVRGDAGKIEFAFFDVNGMFSVSYLAAALAGVYL